VPVEESLERVLMEKNCDPTSAGIYQGDRLNTLSSFKQLENASSTPIAYYNNEPITKYWIESHRYIMMQKGQVESGAGRTPVVYFQSCRPGKRESLPRSDTMSFYALTTTS
jgi:hypothetical protein